MEKLSLSGLSNYSAKELPQEEKLLVNAVVQSGLTQLTSLDLGGNPCWFIDSEASSHLFEFIQEQTCLKELYLQAC